MRPKQLRSFLEEFVTARGGEVEERGENLLGLRLPEDAEDVAGRREVVLAFNLRGLQEDPGSELATVGNPLFDRLLEHARQVGRLGERYRRAGKVPARLPDPAEHFRFAGRVIFGPPQPTYSPLYFFLFRAEYSLEDQADELEVVPLDAISLETLGQTPELVEYWESLDAEPAEGRQRPAAFPVRESILRAAIRLVEKRLRKRLGKIRRVSDERLARETRNIESYYRQLIEESRNVGRRWAVTATQREERIRLLQLDWKRRVEEANQHWRPRIDVRLLSAAASMLPRIAWEVSAAGETKRSSGRAPKGSERARGRSRPRVYWDEAEKAFVEPGCDSCGRVAEIWAPSGDALLCPVCAEGR